MPVFITTISAFLGISPLRLIAYAVVCIAIVIGAFTIRQHYINLGWSKAMARVESQNDKAAEAAKQVETKTAVCSDANGYWDVITQNCKLEDAR